MKYLLVILFLVFAYVQVNSEIDTSNARFRFKSAIAKVQAFQQLQLLLKKNKINCKTYESFCSKMIERSPTLKEQSDKYQARCEEKVKPHVCSKTSDKSKSSIS